jgi:hypothetical protein
MSSTESSSTSKPQVCKKRGYKDKFAAELALSSTRRSRSWSGGKWVNETRIYWCRICRKYHLTSQPQKTDRRG